MKYRHIFYVVGVVFLVIAAVEFFHAHNYTAFSVDGVSGIIFLYLGTTPKTGPKTGRRRR